MASAATRPAARPLRKIAPPKVKPAKPVVVLEPEDDDVIEDFEAPRIALVPDRSYADTYIRRLLPGRVEEFGAFDYAMRMHHNVLIEGPTGTGKTSGIMAWAAHQGLPFYSVSSSIGLEPSQLFGKYIPDGVVDPETGKMGIRWQDGPVTDIMRYGGVLLLNEVNFIPERVGTVLFSALDKRREIQLVDHQGEIVKAHDNCIIFADMNPDYQGTRTLNAAFRNRFAMQFVWDYDDSVEKKLVDLKTLRVVAGKFRAAQRASQFDTPVSTNMLIEFVKLVKDVGMDFAVANFITHFGVDERSSAQVIVDTHKGEIAAEIDAKGRDWLMTPYGDSRFNDKGEWGINWFYEDDEEDEEA